MRGYQDDPEMTAAVMRDGYYHTGDVASRDADGYLTYIGGLDDVFKSSDYRISPFELESVLIEHPAVAEAAVVPGPDALRLSVPKAFIALATGAAGDGGGRALTVVFAWTVHDGAELGHELARRGVHRVRGASPGRFISAAGFEPVGVAGFHLPAGRFATADTVFEDVAGMGLPELRARVQQLRLELGRSEGGPFPHRFAL